MCSCVGALVPDVSVCCCLVCAWLLPHCQGTPLGETGRTGSSPQAAKPSPASFSSILPSSCSFLFFFSSFSSSLTLFLPFFPLPLVKLPNLFLTPSRALSSLQAHSAQPLLFLVFPDPLFPLRFTSLIGQYLLDFIVRSSASPRVKGFDWARRTKSLELPLLSRSLPPVLSGFVILGATFDGVPKCNNECFRR